MNVPGITCPDMSATINGAVRAGWKHLPTKSNHTRGVIEWPATGERVTYSTTPSGGTWKSRAQEIFRISGIDLRRHGSSRRSRKAFKPSGFDPAKAHREAERFHGSAETDAKCAEHQRLVDECFAAGARGGRDDIQIIRDHLHRIQALEDQLNKYGPVVEPFNLNSLGDTA